MKKLLNIVTGLALLLIVECAHAVPSFARQTGLSCNVCHSNPPELTDFGRNFKLKGYVLTDMTATDKVGNSKDLLLSKYIPLSAMILLSNTTFQSDQPASQNNGAGFPQQLSIFLAGGYASHFGGLAQITYTHSDNHFSMDNTDLRYADQGKLGGKRLGIRDRHQQQSQRGRSWNSTPRVRIRGSRRSPAWARSPLPSSTAVLGRMSPEWAVTACGTTTSIRTLPCIARSTGRRADSCDRDRAGIQHFGSRPLLESGVATELGQQLS